MKILHETGLSTILSSPPSAKLLILLRFLRFFAFGSSTIVLALLLHALSFTDARIGAFMSLTLIGDVLSFVLTTFADGLGRKTVLAIGSLMMVGSGIAFACSENWWILVVAGVLGIVSPNGREIGPFSAIEESTLASLTASEKRSDVFAWYALTGSAGGALGKFVTGWAIFLLLGMGWTSVQSYRAVFIAYAVVGLLQLVVVACLSDDVELNVQLGQEELDGHETTTPLLVADIEQRASFEEGISRAPEQKRLLPQISKESRAVVFKLCLLFSLDSLGSGLIPSSWVVYFFSTKFHLPPSSLGTVFSIAALLSAFSALIAASLSKRIGLIRTMVFTHLPSAIALALLPFAPSLSLAIFLLLFRFALASMDIAPKAAFLSAVVLPSERTAVMGFINMVRTGSQSLGPVITGNLSQLGRGWVPFVAAGVMKSVYDLGLLGTFYGYRGREEAQKKRDEEDEL